MTIERRALLFAVPESPRWRFGRGREAEARTIPERDGGVEHASADIQAVGAFIFVLAVPPERGRSLEEIEAAWVVRFPGVRAVPQKFPS